MNPLFIDPNRWRTGSDPLAGGSCWGLVDRYTPGQESHFPTVPLEIERIPMPTEQPGSEASHTVTILLAQAGEGNQRACDQLFTLLYEDLYRRARREVDRAAKQDSLQPTALLHEAYCKLVQSEGTSWKDRHHFMAVASKAMRCILVDAYRAKNAKKRVCECSLRPRM